jgi:putative tryptophan/tyrosine transport system substrate-binding protein
MRRREFIAGLGSATAWPAVARAHGGERMRRIGVLSEGSENDPNVQSQLAELRQGLQQLGWTEGDNLRFDYRWGEYEALRRYAPELVAFAPDVILVLSDGALGLLQFATRTVPIVFVGTIDEVQATLQRSGGYATGFSTFEYSLGRKWLERLKQIAPQVTRVAVIGANSFGVGHTQFTSIRHLGDTVDVDFSAINLRPFYPGDAEEMVRAVAAFALSSNAGLIVTPSARALVLREMITALAAQHGLPAVYPLRSFVTGGGLISVGPVLADVYRCAASYVDRILKGAKPEDLRVRTPTKFETVINLKTAQFLGLTIPETLLATADEVIQ